VIRKVFFYGVLADKFGAGPHELYADTLAMMFAGLHSRFPGFKEVFIKHEWAIVRGDGETAACFTEEELPMMIGGATELHLVPNTEGSWEVALAAAAYIFEAGTVAYYVAAAVIYIGASLVISYALSSLAAALAPNPQEGDQGTGKKEDHHSFLFSGPQNVIEQGGPVPIVYGEFRTGSTVVSIGVAAEEIAV
jgi:predicted phage tail protein